MNLSLGPLLPFPTNNGRAMKLLSLPCLLAVGVALFALTAAEERDSKQRKRGVDGAYGYGGGHISAGSYHGDGGYQVHEDEGDLLEEGSKHQSYKTITITKKVPVFVPKPYPVEVVKHVPVKVPHPVPYPVKKPYPVIVKKPYPVIVEKKVPVTVEKKVPYPVHVPVKVPFPVPYKVYVKKPVPVLVHVPVKVPVPHPVIVTKKVPVFIKSHGKGW